MKENQSILLYEELAKLQQTGFLEKVNRNRHTTESYSDIFDNVLVNFCENISSTGYSFFQQKNDEVDDKLIETFQNML